LPVAGGCGTEEVVDGQYELPVAALRRGQDHPVGRCQADRAVTESSLPPVSDN
jgi:hypothetical protein